MANEVHATIDGPQAVLVVNLQKSQWGEQYYINLGVWFNELGVARQVKENQCHIRARLSSLTPEGMEELLNLDNQQISKVEREQQIRQRLEEVAIPFLRSASSKPELDRMLKDGRLATALVHKNVRAMLASRSAS